MGCGSSKNQRKQFLSGDEWQTNGQAYAPNGYETNGYEPAVYGHDSSIARDILHLPSDVFHRLSRVVMPTDVGRGTSANVNFSGVSRTCSSAVSGGSGGFRRLSSAHLAPVSGTDLQWTASRKDLEETLQAEKAADQSDWSPDRKSEERRLAERLAKLRLDMYTMAGDGNCQFRSVSFNLYGTEEHHGLVRRKALDHMRLHAPDYEPFLGDAAGWTHYLNEMARSGTWGDELTLRAICDSYGIQFNVITSEQHNWLMRYKPQTPQDYGGGPKEIFLTYIAPCHYNAVRRRTSSLPRVFALGRSKSNVDAAMRKAAQQGLPASQVAIPRVGPPAGIPETVLERESHLTSESNNSSSSLPAGQSPNGMQSPFANHTPAYVYTA